METLFWFAIAVGLWFFAKRVARDWRRLCFRVIDEGHWKEKF